MPRRGRRAGRARRAHRAHRTHHHLHINRRRHHHHHRTHFTGAHTTGAQGVGIIYVGGQPVQCTTPCCRVFLAVLIMLIGFIVTMVGYFAKPFWGPEDDWCGFCKEDRLTAEGHFKNCRIVGPIFLAMGFALVVAFCCLHKINKNNESRSSPDVESQQTTATGPDSAAISSGEPTAVVVYPPPPPPPGMLGMPGMNYPQPPIPLLPTAPYPPDAGVEFAYPPSTQQFSFPTAVEPNNPPPSYESAVAAGGDKMSDEVI